ncbi:MAG TPA: PAS domain-containing hybrid sensor histidine kinase/response regulator [Verrucomicrobiae bacterium]|nr:PAS domain-containing hybrid sensor histidine kinase/response regulator [Verrucomicrobiae bacterium]
MLPSWLLFLISAGYVALLFAIAYWGDRRALRDPASRPKPWTYSLALAVYCTSWTFYGAVGRAAERGWDFLPIYLGPILVFLFATPLVARIVRVSRRHNLTSVADFIGARYGRRQELAALVTIIAVVGVLPYLALQLKAIALSLQVLAVPDTGASPHDTAAIMAVLLAVFAILFGTRQVASSENHHGLMLAIAFESVIKLIAFLAVGAFVTWGVFSGLGEAYSTAHALPAVQDTLGQSSWTAGFIAQTVLAMAAILCLPRQFHVTVVENSDVHDLRTARWMFPLYLVVISVFVLPIAAAGATLLADTGAAPDTYVLNVPLSQGNEPLALLAYLGGFSAATSMVIVESVALSTMLSNEVVTPLLLRFQPLGLARRTDLSGLIKAVRRVAIVVLLALAYLYNRNFTGSGTLASIGLLSFAAVLQFAPALVGGVYWRRGSHQGVLAGIVSGFAVWAYTLMLPIVLGVESAFVVEGPFGIDWLRPQALFGVTAFDAVTHGTLWSLVANLVGYVGGSLWFPAGLRERLHAARYVDDALSVAPYRPTFDGPTATVGDLQELLERFFGAERTAQLLHDYATRAPDQAPGGLRDQASPELVRHTERLLAGALGASSARVVLSSMLRGRDMQLEDVIQLLDETSHALQFSRELLQAALEHLSQGVSVVDRELRLVAWNRRYVEVLGYPPGLVRVGVPIEDLVRHNVQRGLLGPGDAEALVQKRVQHLRAGTPYAHERQLPDGSVIEIRGNPMPGGGFVTTYADISAHKRSERALQDLAGSLELRVRARTEELSRLNAELAGAKAEAERANAAKTRFLAAASHDLVQPISAAKLFLAAFDRRTQSAAMTALVNNVENALGSAEKLLAGLLDMSLLDAGAQPVRRRDLPLAQVLEPLAAEFTALAQERGLTFRFVPTAAVARTDAALLRRVLQNFLSNALRYTQRGGVLLGVRRAAGVLRIEVWDTGIGIPPERQGEIFEEFRRLTPGEGAERGLGLGLAIADRIGRLLGQPIGLRSWPGRGSVFSITVPRGDPAAVRSAQPRREGVRTYHGNPLVLCLENEASVLAGMEALLGSWGCRVIGAANYDQALARCDQLGLAPDVAIVDFHLDGQASGIDVLENLKRHWKIDVPGVVVTADHTPAARAAATRSGYGFLQKPIKPAALRAILNRLVLQSSSPA